MTRESDYYEAVTRKIFHNLREHLGIYGVSKEKTKHIGNSTNWTVDASCYKNEDDTLVIIECRRKTTSKINQEEAGGFAFRVGDIGAGSAYMVTPIGFQNGAKKVATAHKIGMAILNVDATDTEYILNVANQLFRGLHVREKGLGSESLSVSREVHVSETGSSFESIGVFRACGKCAQALVRAEDGETFICPNCLN